MTNLYPNRTTPGADGSPRKAHYGDGQQPWDVMLVAGWTPEFAAGSILKYLRRAKDLEHSLESAQWYWERLNELANEGHARFVLGQLRSILTADELAKLK